MNAMKCSNRRRLAAGFTLIELVAVMVVLAVLSGIALPRYFDYRERAMEAADDAALGGIATAFSDAYTRHRAYDSPSTDWITQIAHIAEAMETGELPTGLQISGDRIIDQRGYQYELEAETETEPARLTLVAGSGPDAEGGDGGGAPGGSGGGGS